MFYKFIISIYYTIAGINNCEAKIINEVQDKLVEVRQQAQIKPLKIKATVEQIKQGVPATFDVPITFDNSNFFG